MRCFKGEVREVKDKNVDVEITDERIISFQITDATKKPADLVPADEVEIEASQNDKVSSVR